MNHKLLVAVGEGETSEKVAHYVARACAGCESPDGGIVVFHIFVPEPPFVEGADPVAAEELAERTARERTVAAEQLLADIKKTMILAGVKPGRITTEHAAAEGDITKQIIRAATAHDCDTIVVGHPNRSRLREFLAGGVVDHILRQPIDFTLWLVA